MSEKKSELREKLLYDPKNGFDSLSAEDRAGMERYAEDYKAFLNHSKTERKCVDYAVALAEERGFRAYERGMKLQPGDKVYYNNRGKAIMLAVIGQKSLAEGANIGAAHTDAPRLDLKPRPLYEEAEMAYLKTHYYGGIRKYQWTTIPLELHGVAVLRDGSSVRVDIGDKEGDPQFIICDLLPHLGYAQAKKPLSEAIPAENLNLLVGSEPIAEDEGKERVKLQALKWLQENYGITEEDLISAEICAVPAGKARDIGFDRSLIAAYGHDDRVCAYAELAALFAVEKPERTAICIFADKEEIGSEGVSGMKSAAFDTFMADLCEGQGVSLRQCFENSFCLSADVTAAFDPAYADVFERNNSSFINYGIGLCKYTGSGGKSGASDASAEVVGLVRKLFNDNGVQWQMAELGKTDAGGGGTVAKFMAERNIDTLDAGVPVLSMHAPYETVSKLDCYMTYKGVKTIFEKR
ncbi:MAG: aminopeptidase [Oscillospiraceae bacterium]